MADRLTGAVANQLLKAALEQVKSAGDFANTVKARPEAKTVTRLKAMLAKGRVYPFAPFAVHFTR
ncbi:MAG TPA: hypothetical protein VFW87_07235 [Pirellulales bacterium]|nr:hypothetical protein [Pirellulales bacterium]